MTRQDKDTTWQHWTSSINSSTVWTLGNPNLHGFDMLIISNWFLLNFKKEFPKHCQKISTNHFRCNNYVLVICSRLLLPHIGSSSPTSAPPPPHRLLSIVIFTYTTREAYAVRRPCSDFMDMLRRLISRRIIIIIIVHICPNFLSSWI